MEFEKKRGRPGQRRAHNVSAIVTITALPLKCSYRGNTLWVLLIVVTFVKSLMQLVGLCYFSRWFFMDFCCSSFPVIVSLNKLPQYVFIEEQST